MRVQNNDNVFILKHRIPFVVWRHHRWNNEKRLALQQHLTAQEQQSHTYVVKTHLMTAFTGMVTLYDGAGQKYSAHHSDVVRV